MIQQSTIGLASGAMPGIQAAGPTSGGAVFTSPSSASAASQENLLLPPSFNSQITQPEPLSSILQPSQSQSEESDSDPEDRMQVILEREAADFFGSVLSYKIFDIPIDKRDVVETIEFYNSIPLVPFIPSSIRKPEFTAKWASDALDQAGERIEKKLCPTIKALLLARGAAHGEAKTQIEDALTLVTAALQESRITRVAGRQGFAAARALREEMDDPLLTDYQKEVIKRAQPISTYRSSIGGRSRVRISQRRRFFRGENYAKPNKWRGIGWNRRRNKSTSRFRSRSVGRKSSQ
ncbi:uncharacterized protein MONOS_5217 [Monocercomonoides exilis]|uniref:uncharacterized protein n=1 Tax=Monocercomonoides exilis TaxID=2049356 RepID=UPI003559D45B|nr:hypothetical protein MONOS_5217 [Monocercomonoides exilis]|eukprot:MONOS_5217.1-p1 / transcript=MONOS_5217.1 / gene=MONOS_5217 / organism=Monocercomonoides_exilis_PA203 / gene_product=unspecified product / transcript_product=unspecified product / location=Mono_scaffold00149:62186-63064(-) / protein_length=293 / sequence_SO=supercontig / SO=protein_coding / is_pseudo=false